MCPGAGWQHGLGVHLPFGGAVCRGHSQCPVLLRTPCFCFLLFRMAVGLFWSLCVSFVICPACTSTCLPGDSSGKEPACRCKRHKRLRSDPWVGKIPWRRAWQPTPAFLPGESRGQRSLCGCSPWGHRVVHS